MNISQVQTHSRQINGRNVLLVRITTDQGLTGLGQANADHFGGAIEACLHELKPALIGQDALCAQAHWHSLYGQANHQRGGPVHLSALAALDLALWDIAGKAYSMPAYRLLGGPCRDTVRVCASGWATPGTPEQVARQAQTYHDQGYTTLKIGLWGLWNGPTEANLILGTAKYLEAIRATVGSEVDLILDCAEALNLRSVVAASRAWAPFRPLWVEEPIRHENPAVLARLAQSFGCPIGGGRFLHSRFDFRPLLEAQALDVVQPDVTTCGGLTEMKRLADMAETFSTSLALQAAGGPVALAAGLQLAACTPNFLLLQVRVNEVEAWRPIAGEPFQIKEGYIQLPEGPGLGLPEETLTALPDWR